MRAFRGIAIVAACVAALLALSTGPASAAGWSPTTLDVSPAADDSGAQRVAAAPDGSAVVVWQDLDPCGCGIVHAREIEADGSLGPILDISDPAMDAGDPAVAIGGDGVATFVWVEIDDDTGDTSFNTRRLVNGSLTAPVQIAGAMAFTNKMFYEVEVAANSDGEALATTTWIDFDDSTSVILAQPINADGSLPSAYFLDDPDTGVTFDGHVALADDTAVVSYYDALVGELRYAYFVDGVLNYSASISNLALIPDNDVAINPSGQAVIVWSEDDGVNDPAVRARRMAANGNLSIPHTVFTYPDPDRVYGFQPTVAVSNDGAATLVYGAFDGNDYIATWRRLHANDTLGPAADLSADGRSAIDSRVAVDQNGVATAVWQWGSGCFSPRAGGSVGGGGDSVVACDGAVATPASAYTIQSRRITANGALEKRTDLSSHELSVYPDIDVSPLGKVTAVWSYYDGPPDYTSHVQARQHDGRPEPPAPECQGGSASTTAGSPLTVPLNCNGEDMTISVVGGPAHGSLGSVNQSAKTVVYTPTSGFTGTDSFAYKATNSTGESATVTYTITVGQGSLVLNNLKLSTQRVAPGKKKPLTLTFDLSGPATVTMKLERKFGRKARKACNRTKAKTRLKRRCKIYRQVSTQTMQGSAGKNSMTLDSKVRRTLAPGAYRLTVSAVSANGASSSAASIFVVPWWAPYM